MEDAGTLVFLADLSKDFERTPFKVLEKMYERGLTEKDLVEYLKVIERKDLVALVQKKPKPRNRDINAVATGSEAFSSLLQTAVFNLTQVNKCLELEDREAQLSEIDVSAIQKMEEEIKRIKQCVQDRSSSDSSGGMYHCMSIMDKLFFNTALSPDERTSSTESKKKPILPPMNRPSKFIILCKKHTVLTFAQNMVHQNHALKQTMQLSLSNLTTSDNPHPSSILTVASMTRQDSPPAHSNYQTHHHYHHHHQHCKHTIKPTLSANHAPHCHFTHICYHVTHAFRHILTFDFFSA